MQRLVAQLREVPSLPYKKERHVAIQAGSVTSREGGSHKEGRGYDTRDPKTRRIGLELQGGSY